MKIRSLIVLAFASLLVSTASAETLRGKMDQVYEAFRKLHPFLLSQEEFTRPANKKVIEESLSKIAGAFHKADDINSVYKREPGFLPTLQIVNEMIDDARLGMRNGKSDYAFWRLRTLPAHCMSCHAAHNPHFFYEDISTTSKKSSLEKAELLASTRQFDKATNEFLKVLSDTSDPETAIEVVRKLLVIDIRSASGTESAIAAIEKALSRVKFSNYYKEKIEQWLGTLKSLRKSSPELDDVDDVESFLREVMTKKFLREPGNEVKLLFASGALHRMLAEKNLESEERAKALYLLGFAYSQLQLFFVDEAAEMYLEQCIVEFPGSDEAKKSYSLYDEIVSFQFTGSGGTRIPTDVRLKLMELYNKAHNIPNLDGKI